MNGGLPTGTVTLLFTDVEGSTRLWESRPAAMARALERHDEIMVSSIAERGGYVFSRAGDSFAAAFQSAAEALGAAQAAQAVLEAEPPADEVPLRVRMGLHTGETQERDGDYFGAVVNRAARLMAAGHGGQVLVSDTTRACVDVDGLSISGRIACRTCPNPCTSSKLETLGIHRCARSTRLGAASGDATRRWSAGRRTSPKCWHWLANIGW